VLSHDAGAAHFGYVVDGTTITAFDPGYPAEETTWGEDPRLLRRLMDALELRPPSDESERAWQDAEARAIVLAQRITGVRLPDRPLSAARLSGELEPWFVTPTPAADLLRAGRRTPYAAELVRAADRKQLWSDKYDLQLEYIFDIQEEMARQIAATIEPELSKVEQQLAARKAPESLDAWDCYQRGLWHFWRFTTPGFDSAESYFQRAIAADPNFARGHGALSYVNIQRAFIDEPKDRAGRLETALRQGRHAVALDELDCFCHCALGRALCLTHQNDEALATLDVSLELNPSFAQAYFAQGFNMLWHGREIEAETLLDRATMLSPRDSHISSFHHVRSWAHFSLGEYDIAVEFARRAARQPSVTYQAFASLAASLGLLGDRAQAETAAAELLQRKPNYDIATARQQFFFCNDPGFIDRFVEGLRVAGIAGG